MRVQKTKSNPDPSRTRRTDGATLRANAAYIQPVGLTAEEFRSLLLEFPDEPFRTMLIASVCLGLRGSEVSGLQWGDFSPDDLTVRRAVLRGRVVRAKDWYPRLPVCPALTEVFSKLKSTSRFAEDTDWVFANRYYPRLPYNSLLLLGRIKVGANRVRLGREFGWHTIRWTLARVLASLGFDFSTISRLMRHRSVQTTLQMFTRNRISNLQVTMRPSTRMLTSTGASPEHLRDAMAQVAHVILSNAHADQDLAIKEDAPAAKKNDRTREPTSSMHKKTATSSN